MLIKYFTLSLRNEIEIPLRPIKVNGRIRDAVRAYTQTYHLRKSTLFDDYVKLKLLPHERKDNYMAWIVAQKTYGLPSVQETLERETAMEKIAFDLYKNEKPTQVVRQLLYSAETDETALECGLVLRLFYKMASSEQCVRVLNPSPEVVEELAASIYASQIVFLVSDDILAALYAKQFPNLFFAALSVSAEALPEADFLLVFSGVLDYSNLRNGMVNLSDKASVLALLPEICVRDAENGFPTDMAAEGRRLSSVLMIPSALKAKLSQKKCLVFADETDHSEGISLYSSRFNRESRMLTFLPEPMILTQEQLGKTEKTFRQLAKPEKEKPTENRGSVSDEYVWSAEITLKYNLLTGRKGSCALRVQYVYHTRDKQGKKRHFKAVECCRGANLEDCLLGLESCVLKEAFLSEIIPDVRAYYQGRENCLSLKTLWLLCRQELLSRPSYHDRRMTELMLSCPNVAALVPGDCKEEDWLRTMTADFRCDAEMVEHKYWKQLDLLIAYAFRIGYIELNTLRPIEQRLSARADEKQTEVLKALQRKTFTEAEEAKEIEALFCPENGKIETSFACDGMKLAQLIKHFTPLDNGETCALRWGDMEYRDCIDLWQFIVTKTMSFDGSLNVLAETEATHPMRCIPLPPELVFALMCRRAYLRETFELNEKNLRALPILAEDKDIRIMLQTGKIQWPSRAKLRNYLRKLQREILPESNLLVLPDERKEHGRTVDLNDFSGDIFRNSFVLRYKQLCGGTDGEIAYLLNTVPEDTRSKSYHEYSSDLSQLQMLRKLCRWTNRYARLIGKEKPAEPSDNMLGQRPLEKTMVLTPMPGQMTEALLLLDGPKTSECQIQLNAEYGLIITAEAL